MELKNRFVSICIVSLIGCAAFALPAAEKTVAEQALEQGYDSYKNGDWQSSSIFLRKAVSDADTVDDVTWYMLIMSQMYAENYSSAVNDANYFIEQFPDSEYLSAVLYQKGRALHALGQNDSAVLVLSDFCHQNPKSYMYSSALFWIAECFYEDYNFDTAKSLYERITTEFPDSVKAKDSQVKLDFILQREREEKLLYLLRMTGEEYLSSRESYERQVRMLQNEDTAELEHQLAAARERISELENGEEQQESVPQTPSKPVETKINKGDEPRYIKLQRKNRGTISEEIGALRRKADMIQGIISDREAGDGK